LFFTDAGFDGPINAIICGVIAFGLETIESVDERLHPHLFDYRALLHGIP
jgi:hypothetical protein